MHLDIPVNRRGEGRNRVERGLGEDGQALERGCHERGGVEFLEGGDLQRGDVCWFPGVGQHLCVRVYACACVCSQGEGDSTV